jgi:hypothetical protein
LIIECLVPVCQRFVTRFPSRLFGLDGGGIRKPTADPKVRPYDFFVEDINNRKQIPKPTF